MPPATPAPASPAVCSENPCTYRSWPTGMYKCAVAGFEGTVIRSDPPMDLCVDCASRCWFQMRNCVGFTTSSSVGQRGVCTYYSAITGVRDGPANLNAFVKPGVMDLLEAPRPTTTPAPTTPRPTQRPTPRCWWCWPAPRPTSLVTPPTPSPYL